MTNLELGLFGLAAVGLYLVLSGLPLLGARPTLEERLRRFDVDARLRERRAPAVGRMRRSALPWPTLDAALRPLAEDLLQPLGRLMLRNGVFGGSVERELRVLQPGVSRQAFILRQVLWALGTSAVFLVGFASRDQLGPSALVLAGLAGAVGFNVPWLRLRAAARARRRRLLAELPHVASLLALAMSASLPLDVALGHVGQRSRGLMGQLLRRAHQLAADGTCALLPELRRMADSEDVPELVSFVALLEASSAQGLPLAPGLEMLAGSLRQRSAARLLATAERGTIKMLFPLALVLTPVIVMVALVPGLMALYALVRGGP